MNYLDLHQAVHSENFSFRQRILKKIDPQESENSLPGSREIFNSIMHGIITDIGITVIVSAVVAVLVSHLKQPIILGYLITGIILGPEIGANLINDPESIEVISELGLVLLLFIIGLEINPTQFIASGRKIILPGLLQFPVSVAIGYGFYLLFRSETDHLSALYLGIFSSLSSTAIVVKLLYDKLEIDTFYGKISVGILIFQDIWAILVLALQPGFQNLEILPAFISVGKSILLLGTGFLISRYLLKIIFDRIHKNPEMTVIVSIGWCGIMAAAGSLIGLSMEMGALVAGISISSFPYSIHVTSRVAVLRDFFLSLFFISLGMKIPLPEASMVTDVFMIISFLFFVRALTIIPSMMISGSPFRTSFLASLTLSQISEFSLVIATIGIELMHIQGRLLSGILYAMSVTAILSSYTIKYNTEIYKFLCRLLGLRPQKSADELEKKIYPIVVLGCHRGAREMLEIISDTSPGMLKEILVIDFDMESLKELQGKNIGTLFGDIGSIDTLDHARIKHAKYILSTIPDMLLKNIDNEKIIRMCRTLAPEATIIATAESDHQAMALKKAGAGKVMMPYTMIGDSFANYLLLETQKDISP
ncbi:MAG: cation:proton antiporter [Spirochaetia bacterium]|nr:cation:proton antiporter [Spirochaetia bacterium]